MPLVGPYLCECRTLDPLVKSGIAWQRLPTIPGNDSPAQSPSSDSETPHRMPAQPSDVPPRREPTMPPPAVLEEQWRIIAEISPVQLWTALPDGQLDYVTVQTARNLGVTPERLLADGWQNVVHPDDLAHAVARWTHSLATGEPYDVEFRLRLASGQYAWYLVRAAPQLDGAGRIVRWFGSNTNIDDERSREKQVQELLVEVEQQAAVLREQKALLELENEIAAALALPGDLADHLVACAKAVNRHIDAASVRIWTVDASGSTLELQASAGLYIHMDSTYARIPVGEAKIGQIAATRTAHVTNQVIGDPRIADQAWVTREAMVAFAGYPIVLATKLIGVIAVFARHTISDVTLSVIRTAADSLAQAIERRVAEEKVRVSETWLTTTLSSIGDGVIATDDAGNVTFINPVAEALTGWKAAEAAGVHLDSVFAIFDEDSRVAIESPVAKVLRGATTAMLTNHTVLVRRDGTKVPIEDSAAPIRDVSGGLRGVVLVFRDAGEKRRIDFDRALLLMQEQRARSDAEAARAELRSLFMQAPAPICVLRGPTHIYELANPAYMELIGNERTILGVPSREAHPELAAFDYFDVLDRVYSTCERYIGQRRLLVTRDAPRGPEEIIIDFVYDPFYDHENHVAGVLVIGFDVTASVRANESTQAALKERERALRITEEARSRAELASRVKDEFLATASHELRTPLNAILGWAQILRLGGHDAATVTQGLETIERNARAQAQLIDDILDGSRIITGKLQLEIRAVNLPAVIHAALDAVRAAASAREITVEVNLHPDASHIQGDPERIQQVLWNLLNNAIKFTPKGGVVKIRAQRSVTHIEVSVRDNGQGIAPGFLPHVFDRFHQADSSTTRRHGGLGLGLALVRSLVEAHGGTARAESEGEGKGSVFTVTLPVRAVIPDAHENNLRAHATTTNVSALVSNILADVRVLVLDDEPDARDLVAAVLRARAAEVLVATSVEEAITLLESRLPHVIISDIGMPVTDGYAFLKRVRALHTEGANRPAIALTAYVREQDRRRAIDAGFQAFLAKPVEATALVQLVFDLAHSSAVPSTTGA